MSPYIIRVTKSRRMRRVWYAARMGRMRDAQTMLVGKPDAEVPLGRPRP
jgi:hypothetical protein